MLYRVRFRPIWFVSFSSFFTISIENQCAVCFSVDFSVCSFWPHRQLTPHLPVIVWKRLSKIWARSIDYLWSVKTGKRRFKWKKRKRLAIMKRGNAIFVGQSHRTIETVPSFSAFCRSCNSRALACLLPSPGLTLSTAFSLRSRSLCRTRWAVFLARRSRNRSVFSFSVEPLRAPLTGSVQSSNRYSNSIQNGWQPFFYLGIEWWRRRRIPWTSWGANRLASLTATGAISSIVMDGMLLTIFTSGAGYFQN